MSPRVAALYVDVARGPYASLPGVDCWGVERDARQYDGPHPVVAHPPCAQWSRLRHFARADDGTKSCAPRAIEQVRRWGGVVEHPASSSLWAHLALPPPGGLPDRHGGRTIEVRQCDWGHPAEKRTWLYVVGPVDCVPPMPPRGEPTHCVESRNGTASALPRMPKRDRHITPPALARWLVDLARRCA